MYLLDKFNYRKSRIAKYSLKLIHLAFMSRFRVPYITIAILLCSSILQNSYVYPQNLSNLKVSEFHNASYSIDVMTSHLLNANASMIIKKENEIKYTFLNDLTYLNTLSTLNEHEFLRAIGNVTNVINNDTLRVRNFDYIFALANLEISKALKTLPS